MTPRARPEASGRAWLSSAAVFAAVLAAAGGCNQLTGAADIEIDESTCVPGSTEGCTAPNGCEGVRSCGADGTFDDCECLDGQAGSGGAPPRETGGAGGAVGNGGAAGSGGVLGNAGSQSTGVCEPGMVRACTGAGACAGEQRCDISGNGFTPCTCSSSCSASGGACTSPADCCGEGTRGALCINSACRLTCAEDSDCAPNCCLTWYTGDTFSGFACGDAAACGAAFSSTPVGELCGGDTQCDSLWCDTPYPICYDICLDSSDCAPSAVCVGEYAFEDTGECARPCATDADCAIFNMVCADVTTAEVTPARVCVAPFSSL